MCRPGKLTARLCLEEAGKIIDSGFSIFKIHPWFLKPSALLSLKLVRDTKKAQNPGEICVEMLAAANGWRKGCQPSGLPTEEGWFFGKF